MAKEKASFYESCLQFDTQERSLRHQYNSLEIEGTSIASRLGSSVGALSI